MTEAPFYKFWRALNEELAGVHAPELTYAEAREIWEKTIAKASTLTRLKRGKIDDKV